MISRLFWNYGYGRARYLIVPSMLSAILFFTNMWFFPTPYLHIDGVDQVELSATPGDEIPVRIAEFDSANGWWLTGGINAVFPTDSEETIEIELIERTGSEWTWENFGQRNDIKKITVDGTLTIPRYLPTDGRTVQVDVIGVVSYLTVDSWKLDADVADSLLVTLTTRQHSSATFRTVEQSIGVVSLSLGIATGCLGVLLLLWGAVARRFGRNTNRTLAYMRRTPKLLRDLQHLVDSKARRLPEGYWTSELVESERAEFDALSVRVARERTKLRAALDATASQLGLENIGNLRFDQVDKNLETHEVDFTMAYRDLTMMLREHRRWYLFWYWA
jgi:hypothetical protein